MRGAPLSNKENPALIPLLPASGREKKQRKRLLLTFVKGGGEGFEKAIFYGIVVDNRLDGCPFRIRAPSISLIFLWGITPDTQNRNSNFRWPGSARVPGRDNS
jgi:hypothetical protein